MPLGAVSTDPLRQEIALLVDAAARSSLTRKPAQIFPRHAAKSVNPPGVERQHQMSRKTFRYLNRARVAKTFLLECRGERMNAQRRVGHRDGSDHSTEYQPWRRLVFFDGSKTTMSASEPGAMVPLRGKRPKIFAGEVEVSSTKRLSEMRPGITPPS